MHLNDEHCIVPYCACEESPPKRISYEVMLYDSWRAAGFGIDQTDRPRPSVREEAIGLACLFVAGCSCCVP